MNKKMITYILGRMLGVEALVLLIPAFVGALYGEKPYPFLLTSAILMLLAVMVGRKNLKTRPFMEKKDLSLLQVHGYCGLCLGRFRFVCQAQFRII